MADQYVDNTVTVPGGPQPRMQGYEPLPGQYLQDEATRRYNAEIASQGLVDVSAMFSPIGVQKAAMGLMPRVMPKAAAARPVLAPQAVDQKAIDAQFANIKSRMQSQPRTVKDIVYGTDKSPTGGVVSSEFRKNLRNFKGDGTLHRVHRGDNVAYKEFDGTKNKTSVHNLLGTYVSREPGVAKQYARSNTVRRGGDATTQQMWQKRGKSFDWDQSVGKMYKPTQAEAKKFGYTDEGIDNLWRNGEPSLRDVIAFAPDKYNSTQGMKALGYDTLVFDKGRNSMSLNDSFLKSVHNRGTFNIDDKNIYKGLGGLGMVDAVYENEGKGY